MPRYRPYAPPFKVACRICYQIEGKLKNYKNDAVYIKAYECLTGYQFEEVPYLNKFCPSCACSLKKMFRFRKACQSSHYWLMDYMNTGRKVSQPYIRTSQEYQVKYRPVQLEVWQQDNQTVIDCVHRPKRHKPKLKVVYDIGVAHLSVPKDPAEKTWHITPTPNDFSSDYDPNDSDLDEEELLERAKGEAARDSLIAAYFSNLADDEAKTRDVGTMTEAVPVEESNAESSDVSLGSNPAELSQLMREGIRNKSDVELAELGNPRKRRTDEKENEPQPTTSNVQPKLQKNQVVQPKITIPSTVKLNMHICMSCGLVFRELSMLEAHTKTQHQQGPSRQTPQPSQVLSTSLTNRVKSDNK